MVVSRVAPHNDALQPARPLSRGSLRSVNPVGRAAEAVIRSTLHVPKEIR